MNFSNKIKHIAVIMDGNKRWAKKNKVSEKKGYLKGLDNIKTLTNLCLEKKIKYLTIYALSNENLNRKSVGVIFQILINEYIKIINQFKNEKLIKVNFIGEKNNLPKKVIKIIKYLEENTENNKKLILNIAFNYSTEKELISIVKKLTQSDRILSKNISKETIYKHLYLAEMPDPDLLIRTGGYSRLSNFILLNLSYTELFFIQTLWPDLSKADILDIFNKFYKIKRNYGL